MSILMASFHATVVSLESHGRSTSMLRLPDRSSSSPSGGSALPALSVDAWSILSDAECIMSPYIFHGKFHKSGKTHDRLHVIREYEERSARAINAAVQSESVHHGSHGKLAYSAVEKLSRKSFFAKGLVFLRRIPSCRCREIGRADNHILDMFREFRQHDS